MVELDTPETPEYLAWVQRLADQAARVRDGQVRDVEVAEINLEAVRSALESYDAAHGQ